MTLSVVACDLREESWGVAVASKYLAVGSLVPAVEAGAGAIATQGRTNVSYRSRGLELLRRGMSASSVLDTLLESDTGREVRQVGIVDGQGRGVTWTGTECAPFSKGVAGENFAIQGNILLDDGVLEATVRAWLGADASVPLAFRLLEALSAGDAAGGDRRGRQSAALLVARRGSRYSVGSDVEVDLRVDDGPGPICELRRLLGLRYGAGADA